MSSKFWVVLFVFISWTFVSWNWYTCDIKGYCPLEEELSAEAAEEILPIESMSVAQIIATAEDEPATVIEPITIVPKAMKENAALLREVLPFHFTFMYNSEQSRFRQKSKAEVESLCNELISSNLRLNLTGHTDDAGEKDNVILGLERANTVKDYLIKCGCPESRLDVFSKGSSEAIYGNQNVNQRAKNRRVEISLSDE